MLQLILFIKKIQIGTANHRIGERLLLFIEIKLKNVYEQKKYLGCKMCIRDR